MNFYLIFHHNLQYSSIPSCHYEAIIENIYSRLLDIAECGIPLGLEFTGETLETIEVISPGYIKRLKNAIKKGFVELIGSSYSQAIFPLIPGEVNEWNIGLGLETYKRILHVQPKIAYLNELVFSESIPGLYGKFGYEAFCFDWNNAIINNPWPEKWRYTALKHLPSGLVVLWIDAIMFQKFQRVHWGDIDDDEYWDFLGQIFNHAHQSSEGEYGPPFLCLYGSDAEVYDYRPGSLTEPLKNGPQLAKMEKLLKKIQSSRKFSIVLPSSVLPSSNSNTATLDVICTPAHPIRTKKQQKYNVVRWAVTGRAASKMNTQCYRLLKAIKHGSFNKEQKERLTKYLVTLWGSDFRTHTTDEKIDIFRNRMGVALELAGVRHNQPLPVSGPGTDMRSQDENDVSINDKGRRVIVDTPGINLILLKNKGLSIGALTFKDLSKDIPLIGTVPHGFFNTIALGSDFFSGHLILLTQDGRQFTDISCNVDYTYKITWNSLIIKASFPCQLPGMSILKTYNIKENSVELTYDMYAIDLRPASLRLGIITIWPGAFERDSLYYKASNGGIVPETFRLKGQTVRQDEPVNHIVTTRSCLGNTTGELEIGDRHKKIAIKTDHAQLYSVPLLHYEEARNAFGEKAYFFRIYHTICERSDVSNVFWKGHMQISFKIEA